MVGRKDHPDQLKLGFVAEDFTEQVVLDTMEGNLSRNKVLVSENSSDKIEMDSINDIGEVLEGLNRILDTMKASGRTRESVDLFVSYCDGDGLSYMKAYWTYDICLRNYIPDELSGGLKRLYELSFDEKLIDREKRCIETEGKYRKKKRK